MPVKTSRRLVIDASIARASGGEEATFPTSRNCRDFLIAVRAVGHRAVMTLAIIAEWNNHQSHFARRWRRSMEARKKMVWVGISADSTLRDKIKQIAASDNVREAMLKDLHLVEAAQATDQTVASLDENVKNLFASAARNAGELKSIVWVNPDKTREQVIAWLKNGAKPEKKRTLGLQ